VTNIRIVLEVLVGVIVTLNPVMSTKDVEVLENTFVLVVLKTCSTVPVGIDALANLFAVVIF
jgi:hypothetical protein